MTNESAILGLLADLYKDRAALQKRVAQLEQELATLQSEQKAVVNT